MNAFQLSLIKLLSIQKLFKFSKIYPELFSSKIDSPIINNGFLADFTFEEISCFPSKIFFNSSVFSQTIYKGKLSHWHDLWKKFQLYFEHKLF